MKNDAMLASLKKNLSVFTYYILYQIFKLVDDMLSQYSIFGGGGVCNTSNRTNV